VENGGIFMIAQISKIKVTNRIRKEINKIAELSADIQINGLINPITVMSLEGEEYQLLAGLRRLRATEMLGLTEIAINVVAPADAEAVLRIEISENEQREEFTFSEKMDFARMLEAIEKEKAKARMLGGKKIDSNDANLTPTGAEGRKGETREIVAEKIGMGRTNYDCAKYIADNAPDEIIEELDKGQRTIRKTYNELKAKEKAEKSEKTDKATNALETEKEPVTIVEENLDVSDEMDEDETEPTPSQEEMNKYLSKADIAALERNAAFRALSDAEKVVELQKQIKEQRARARGAEMELGMLKQYSDNQLYHKNGIIDNLKARLKDAEARIYELESKYCPNAEGNYINPNIKFTQLINGEIVEA